MIASAANAEKKILRKIIVKVVKHFRSSDIMSYRDATTLELKTIIHCKRRQAVDRVLGFHGAE